MRNVTLHPLPRRALGAALAALATTLAAPALASAWTSPVRVSNIADTVANGARVVVDGSGRATAAWAAYNPTNAWTVQVARYENGTWSAPTTLSQAGRWAKRPAVAVDDTGNVTAVWAEATSANPENAWTIRAATAPAGSTAWTSTTVTGAATSNSSTAPTIVVEPDGDATVAYMGLTPNGVRPYAVRRVAGTWKTPVMLADAWAEDAAIARTGAGAVVAAWMTSTDVKARTLTSTADDGTWGPVRSINSGSTPSLPFTLAAGPSQVVATWGAYFGFCFNYPCNYNYYVMSARLDPDTGWLEGSALTVGSVGMDGAAVVKRDGTVVYSYRGSSTLYARPASNGVLGSPTSTLSTTADAKGLTSWLDRSGNPITTWVNTGTVGIGIATNTASGWPAAGTATSLPLASADQPRGASGGSAERPVSMVVATGSASNNPGVFATSAFTTPTAPTLDSATLSGTSVDIAFQPPADNGGLTITGYTATCTSSDGGATMAEDGASSPITVTGLDLDRTYTCAVTADNSAGTSPASSPSPPLTPAAPPAPPGDSTAPAGGTPAPAATGSTNSTEGPAPAPPRRYSLALGSSPTPAWSPSRTGANQSPSTIRTLVMAPGPGTIEQSARDQRLQSEARPSARARRACATVVRVKAAGPVTVRCTLTPRAQAMLRTHALRLRVVTTFTAGDGSVGVSVRRVVIPRTPVRVVRTPVAG